ncbi:MAG: nucleoside-diphosphate kinase [Alphaproteobacteria bacterium]|nr:nucleoside-diphosphate kinase [Alphaproteobacteria bacterium]|tara:strand:+ start:1584 stop:1985 length:402 start_codon:yes stop_codon:yes gene_type:complete
MPNQKTLSIIKPDAVKAGHANAINLMIENAGLKILKKKELNLTTEQAKEFYSIHSDKPFYNELCNFMTSGPIIVQMLEGENAIELYRKVMGATNPDDAEENTIRKKFATSIQENAVHGSDSEENALKELNFFF